MNLLVRFYQLLRQPSVEWRPLHLMRKESCMTG
ncbi:hypothetical protein AN403_6110 [Pseudomonas fluorescens]|uniref:Uncharacterized protein n=1 Tax=Pseudomonas fluorescens TaxID=294 RepID=A0A0P8X7C8_PSEFL|nr:hypothetical protein AN403_6110 [Pseudomonas fluorescens]